MPSRTRSKVSIPPVSEYIFNDVSIGGSSSYLGPFLTAHESESMSDVVTPSYSERSRKGETIINPCTYQRVYRQSSGPGNASFSYRADGVNTSYSVSASGPMTLYALTAYPFSFGVASVDEESSKRSAILSAIAGIDSTPLANGEDLGELKETLQFLRSPLQGILKEMKKRNIKSLLKTPASAWLTYRFAFSPLVRSIHDILSETMSPTKTPADIRTSHGRSEFSDTWSGQSTAGPPHDSLTCTRSNSIQGSYHAAIRYRINKPTYDWRWRYGLRNKDILPTYWAIMPLSFMVDRIFDVSSMVAATQNLADPSIQILGASLSRRREDITASQVINYSSNDPKASYSGNGEAVIDFSYQFSRAPFSPNITQVIPPIKVSGLVSDSTKIADLVSLIVARIR